MQVATLYFHYPCFDGLISAALAWEFLEAQKGWRVGELCPVNYTVRNSWLASELKHPCAIVDFLYHPSADFWADHHATSMLNKEAEADYQRRRAARLVLVPPTLFHFLSLLLGPIGADQPQRILTGG